jgi:hypothetical protein
LEELQNEKRKYKVIKKPPTVHDETSILNQVTLLIGKPKVRILTNIKTERPIRSDKSDSDRRHGQNWNDILKKALIQQSKS